MVDSPSSEDRPTLPPDLFSILKRSRKQKQELLLDNRLVLIEEKDKKKKEEYESFQGARFFHHEPAHFKVLKSWFFFSGFFTQLHKLRSLRRSFLHFQNIYCREKSLSWLKNRKLDLYRLRRYSTWKSRETMLHQKILINSKTYWPDPFCPKFKLLFSRYSVLGKLEWLRAKST